MYIFGGRTAQSPSGKDRNMHPLQPPAYRKPSQNAWSFFYNLVNATGVAYCSCDSVLDARLSESTTRVVGFSECFAHDRWVGFGYAPCSLPAEQCVATPNRV